MAIILTKKSNKTQIIGIIGGKGPEKEAESSLPVGAYPPFIDKLTVIVIPANEQDAHQICSAFFSVVDDKEVFQSAGQSGAKSGGFNVVKLISLGAIPQRPHLSIKHQDKKVERLRLEFNPRKIGEEGLAKLHAVLTMFLPNGWAYVITHGHITRIDIAVNIPDIRMDEFLFLPPQGLTVKEWGQDGHLQTMYLGKPKGNQTVIYSVKQKRLAQGKPWAGNSVVRVEKRLKFQKLKLTDLGSIKNPFAKMVLTHVLPPPPPDEKEWQWSMFEDSVKVRGLPKALALLPTDRKKKYRAYLSQNKSPWWNPEAKWSLWPSVYAALLKHSG